MAYTDHTVALNMIMKNESDHIDRCFGSMDMSQFDQVVIADTGSTDDSIAKVEAWRPKIKDLKIIQIPWKQDFAWARQQALNETTTEYVMWVDFDDIVEGTDSLRAIINQNPHIDAFMCKYNYAKTETDEVVCELIRERICRVSKFHWAGRLHEVLISDISFTQDLCPHIIWHHQPRMTEEASAERKQRNVSILLDTLEKDPNEPRTYFYLGNAYMGLRDPKKARDYYIEYCKRSHFDEEKYQALCRTSKLFLEDGMVKEAKNYAYSAVELLPNYPIAYYLLGEILRAEGKPAKALAMLENGLRCKVPHLSTAENPADFTYVPRVMKFELLCALEQYEEAVKWFNEIAPGIKDKAVLERLMEQLMNVEEMATRQELMRHIVKVRQYLIKNDEAYKASLLTKAVPYTLEMTPTAKQMRDFDKKNLDDAQDFKEESGLAPFKGHLHDLEKGLPKATWLWNWLQKHPNVKTILDVGCNEGWFPFWLEKKGYTVIGVDANKSVVQTAKNYAKEYNSAVQFYDSLDAVAGQKFDAVMSFDVIEHVLDDKGFVSKLMDFTDKYVLLCTPNGCFSRGLIHQSPDGTKQHHVRVYTTRTLLQVTDPYGVDESKTLHGNRLICMALTKEHRSTKRIGIYCGQTPEQWGPDALERGCGGSEEAVIHMSARLQAKGWQVVVYNNQEPEVVNGVWWLTPNDLDGDDKFDAFIGWRQSEIFGFDTLGNLGKKFVWLHDVPFAARFNQKVVENIDGVFVLSEYHKSLLPEYVKPKAIISANGIDSAVIKAITRTNDPHKLVWTSSYMRGIEWLLEAWPDIRKEVPDAELHVMYGWETTDANPPFPPQIYGTWREKINSLLGQEGITHYGRLPQKKAMEVMAQCGILPYLTLFPEISCITVMKAQALGVIPVTTDVAALSETNRYGLKFKPQVDDKEFRNYSFLIDKLIGLMKDEKQQEKLRAKMSAAVDEYSWDRVATQWDEIFNA